MGFKISRIARPAFGGLLWSLASAAVAGIGWKLGMDLYDCVRSKSNPDYDPERPDDYRHPREPGVR